jgi:phosphoglycerate dehydrogenase-like enzyme
VTRVAVLDDYQGLAGTIVAWPEGVEVVPFTTHLAGEDELVEALRGFEVVVAMRERTAFPRSVFERLPGLRLLVTTGMRNAVIDVAAARERGIVVCGTWGTITGTVELTWALILAVVRDLPGEAASVRAGGWQRTLGTDLAGHTLGLLGLGNIGSRVAQVGRAFGMDVLAWSANLTDERAAEHGATRVDLDELLQRSDVVSVHLVLSDRTHGLVGARELELMGPSSFLVNTSRGPIVDDGALVAALERGTIAGAGLDVFAVEPLPEDHPYRRLSNVVATPHIGYVTEDCYRIFFDHIVEDVAAWQAGTPVRVISP